MAGLAAVVGGLVPVAPASAADPGVEFRGCISGRTTPTVDCELIPEATADGKNTGLDSLSHPVVSPDGLSVYAASTPDSAIAHFAADSDTGDLEFVECITGESGAGGPGPACRELPSATSEGPNSGLFTPTDIDVSPDGKSVYVAALGDGVTHFTRDPADGKLTFSSCLSSDSDLGPLAGGPCGLVPGALSEPDGRGVSLPWSVAISPDGSSMYAGTFHASLAHFDLADDGTPTYRGCLSGLEPAGTGAGACELVPHASATADGSGMSAPRDVEMSHDGSTLYAPAYNDDAVAWLNRDTNTGELSFAGCIAGNAGAGPAGSGACTEIPSATATGELSGLELVNALSISPDDRWVYASSWRDSAVSRFRVDETSGGLTYEGCVTGQLYAGPGGSGACPLEPAQLGTMTPFELSPDGEHAYAGLGYAYGVGRFARDVEDGTFAFAGCTAWTYLAEPVCAKAPPGPDHHTLHSGNGGIAVSPDGGTLYRADEGDASILWFDAPAGPVPPQTTIDAAPPAATNQTAVTFEFSSTEPGSSFECRLDGGDFRACSGPGDKDALGSLADGAHAFEVRATDADGNVEPDPARHEFRVDTVAPETSITGAAVVVPSPASFTFSSNEASVEFECRVDGAAFEPCSGGSSHEVSGLAEGPHTIRVRAIDDAGNVDPTPAQHAFTVDSAAPRISIRGPQFSMTNDSTPTVSFTASEPVRFRCSLDGAPATACSGPGATHTTPPLRDGFHVLDVEGRDAAGHAGKASVGVFVDTVAPESEIHVAVAKRTTKRSARFSIAASEELVTHECKLDSRRWKPCEDKVRYRRLSVGRHRFRARTTDLAGNVEAKPATWRWTVVRG